MWRGSPRGVASRPGVAGDAVRLVSAQAGLAVAAAAAFFGFRGASAAVACLAGGGIALALTALHARRVRLATRATQSRPGSETLVLAIGVFERFAVAAALFAVGIGYAGLDPLPLVAGFAICQVGWFFSGSLHRPGGKAET